MTKNRDWTYLERRLGAADAQVWQEDKTVRATLLTIVAFGVAVLAGIAVYLICLSSPLQGDDPGTRVMRTRRSI